MDFALAEYLLGKHCKVDAPVAPDVTTVGFHIFIFIALCVPVVAQVHGALIEEISLAHAHPVQFGLAAEEAGTLLCEVGVALNLLCKGLVSAEVLPRCRPAEKSP